MSSIHTFNLESIRPHAVLEAGTSAMANKDNFSILNGMALYSLRLDSGGVREPHWHPNADELSYCVSGRALVTIFSPGAGHDTFTVDAGEIVFIPKSYLHHIENIGDSETKFAIAFNHEKPEDIGISGSTGSIPDQVLGATFGLGAEYFSNFKKSSHDLLITLRSKAEQDADNTTTTTTITKTYQTIPNYHKFNLKDFPPMVQTKGGSVSLGNADSFG